MPRLRSALLSGTALLALAGLALPHVASAQLLGTSVTGSINFGTLTTNFYDPGNGFVPTGYLNKTQGTTVTIADPDIEFGFFDGGNRDTADFTDTQLTLTDIASTAGGAGSWKQTFIDSAFVGKTLTELSDNFPNGGVTGTLVGDTLTFTMPGFGGRGTFTAVYSLTNASTAVPEPGTMALLAGMGVSGLLAVRRARRNR